MPNKKNPIADAQGLVRLATDATLGTTKVVQAMHQRILAPPGMPRTIVQQLLGAASDAVYGVVRGTTHLVGRSVDHSLGLLSRLHDGSQPGEQREAIRAAINGVLGDHLDKTNNPLAIPMHFRFRGKAIALSGEHPAIPAEHAKGRILLLLHGLCMNDGQWTRNGHNHGEELAADWNATPVHLHYNSGRHISANGEELASMLEQLLSRWPVAVENLSIVGFSMGGLITRSAVYFAQENQLNWLGHLRKIIFLGTPHHGARMERAGNLVDSVLEAVPYAKPFARIGKIRSAGITDLRHGNVHHDDWHGKDRFEPNGDQRRAVPLPVNITCYSIAGLLGKGPGSPSSLVLGDGLVSLDSAHGVHGDPAKTLAIAEENKRVVYGTAHMDLLGHPAVFEYMKEWLGADF